MEDGHGLKAADRARDVRQPPCADMVWIPSQPFRMGSDRHYPEERPAHLVSVDGFWIDRYPVTNARFARFVEATGHMTFAEKEPDPAQYPGALPEMLYAGSLVFAQPAGPVDLRNMKNWWTFLRAADWRHPQGQASSLDGLEQHPVVHVTFGDAEALAAWEGKSLPTEAEWELAARGGLEGADYAWGHTFLPGDRHMANTWQGQFPWQNLSTDGYERTSAVGAFPANGYGLHDMIGVAEIAAGVDSCNLVALDDALRTLEALNPRESKVVELRFFGGLSLEETAEVLHVSVGTVRRDWTLARAWLFRELTGANRP